MDFFAISANGNFIFKAENLLLQKENNGKVSEERIQLDVTYDFIMLMLGSTCFGHHYAHRQELTTVALVTT